MAGVSELIQANVLVAGEASGKALVLEDALSFWGGFDPSNGEIIDVHHPQYKTLIGNSILFIPQSRGSAGTPAGIAETLRNGSGPRAFILGKRDVNIGVGVLVANRLYDLQIPVLEITLEQMSAFKTGAQISIDCTGSISIGA